MGAHGDDGRRGLSGDDPVLTEPGETGLRLPGAMPERLLHPAVVEHARPVDRVDHQARAPDRLPPMTGCTERPQQGLGQRTPAEYAALCTPTEDAPSPMILRS